MRFALVAFAAILTLSPAAHAAYEPASGADVSGQTVTANGIRALSAWFGDAINIIAEGADKTGATATDAAFTSAISDALGRGVSTEIYLPCGTYKVSQAQSITTTGNQGIWLHGASSACVTINQTADTDTFDVSLANYGGTFSTGAFKASGIRFLMSAASTTRTALNVASTAASGALGVPVWLTDLTFAATSSHTWANEIIVNQIPNLVYIDHINGSLGSGATGTHILVEGNSTSYTTGAYISDTSLVYGNGVTLGNYLQGIHVVNLNTINTTNAFTYSPTAGVGVEVELARSALQGYTTIAPSGVTVGDIRIHDDYFYSYNPTASTALVNLSGVTALNMHDNIYSGQSSVASVSGLSLTGSNNFYPITIANELFSGFLDSGTGLQVVNNGTAPILFKGLVFANNSNNISDTGTQLDQFISTTINTTFYHIGYGQSLTANGQVKIDQSATLGLSLTGEGSTNDISLNNKSGSAVCRISTGALGFNCNAYLLNNTSTYLFSLTFPSSVSGFSTSTADTISNSNGSAAWTLTVGTTPVNNTATFTLATGYSAHGLDCSAYDQTNSAIVIAETAQSSTSLAIGAFSRTTGAATTPGAGDVIQIGPCVGH